MIVVEGPDGSGKTTLAKWIEEEFGIEYRRAPTLSSTHGPDELAVAWFEDQLREDSNAVYDRVFAISEPIYQLATPGRPLMVDANRLGHMFAKLWVQCDLLIICLPPWEVARQTMEDDNRLALQGVDQLALEKIHWAYGYQYHVFKECYFDRVTRYDYTSMTTSHIEEAINGIVSPSSRA